MIPQRLLHPASKLATTRLWHAISLTAELDRQDADENALYEAMDWLLQQHQDRIEQRLAKRHLQDDAQVQIPTESEQSFRLKMNADSDRK